MESSTGLKVMVILMLVVVIAATTGMFVISQTTNPGSPPAGRTLAMPLASSEKSNSQVDEQDKEWKSRLTYQQYMVTRKKETEAPWSGKYWDHKGIGVYTCICCGTPLFDSSTKFESGTGLPSFYQPINEKDIETAVDTSLLTSQTEVLCHKCNAHLGHRFEDGPEPTGLRYCINSAALDFKERAAQPKTNK